MSSSISGATPARMRGSICGRAPKTPMSAKPPPAPPTSFFRASRDTGIRTASHPSNDFPAGVPAIDIAGMPVPAHSSNMFEGFTRTEIQTRGARIHLRHGGSGPPLLLLHGNPLTHVSWHAVAARLAGHFHLICPDLRGYGDSLGPESGGENRANYSFRAMAWDQVE